MAVASSQAGASAMVGPAVPEYTPPAICRVSYVLDNIDTPQRYFRLPSQAENASPSGSASLERSGPLLLQGKGPEAARLPPSRDTASHPRHRLPVSSLAIDTTTAVRRDDDDGASSYRPSGILYTGGRDGMISAWELGLPMRRRASRRRTWRSSRDAASDEHGHDPLDEDDDQDEDMTSRLSMEGAGTLKSKSLREAHAQNRRDWDFASPSDLKTIPPRKTTFRQCIGSHTDWINDIVLVNNNQTVISASSDRTVNLWNPHDSLSSLKPKVLGTHKDYVRALAHASQANWVASGSFDKTIKLWDVQEVRSEPMITLAEPHVHSSIYALSTNARGSVIVGGSPERMVRAWDPRSGKQIGQLIGHSDAVRSVLVSEDGVHVLSASADSTIRLWNLAEQRCLHTFTHHTDSVWSLYSDHPDLDIFYSGDRGGIVCKVDWERCAEVSEGECVVLAHDKTLPDDKNEGLRSHSSLIGINKIIALQNSYFWTASASGSVNRWKDVPSRISREALYPLTQKSRSTIHDENVASIGQDQGDMSASIPTTANPRISALRGQHQHRSSGSGTSVSFATQLDDRTGYKSFVRLSDSPDPDSPSVGGDNDDDGCELFGVPFDSLVCLAPLNDPYGAAVGLGSLSVRNQSRMGLGGTEDTDDIFSSASLVSIPAALRSSYQALRDGDSSMRSSMQIARQQGTPLLEQTPSFHSGLHTSRRDGSAAARPTSVRSGSLRFVPILSNSYEDGHASDIDYKNGADQKHKAYLENAEEARLAFEDRELAIDARPLRSEPEDTIWCARGLIRCALLNDRRHCLSIDSAAEVLIWDVILGECLGAFLWSEVLQAARAAGVTGSMQAGDALDIVSERIQGSSATPSWCHTDTRTGSLTVHLEYPRCFDAELYTDEIGDVIRAKDVNFNIREDQRINIGLSVLKSLFVGFIDSETGLRLASGAPLKDGTLLYERPDTLERVSSSSLASKNPPRLQLSRAPASVGMTIALASSPKTPAILSAPSPLTPKEEHGMSSLQKLLEDQRQAVTSKGNQPTTLAASPSDYFSLHREGASGASTPKLKTPGGEKGSSSVLSPGGSSGFMGRIRLGLRRDVGGQKREAKTPSGNESEAGQGTNDSEEAWQSMSEMEAHKQLQKLRALLIHAAKHPEDPIESPRLGYNPSTALIISESSHDSGGFRVTYRGLVGSTDKDAAMLELHAPFWLLEHLLVPGDAQMAQLKNKDKMTFLLVPWSDPTAAGDKEAGRESSIPPLAPLPGNNARLTATRMLRIKKTCGYVADRLQLLENASSSASGNGSGATSIAASRRSSASAQPATPGTAPGLSGWPAGTSPEGNSSARLAMTRLQQHQQSQQQQQQLSTSITSLSSAAGSEHGSETLALGAAQTAAPTVPATGNSPAMGPTDYIEILCNDQIVPTHLTLAQVQRYIWKTSMVPKLEYRLKASHP